MAAMKTVSGAWNRVATTAIFDVDASAVRAPTPSWSELRERHHAAAAHYGSPLMTAARLAYAYPALAAEGVLLAARWVVHSPARLAVAAVLVFLVLLWM
jgi:hypothetical protein